MSQIDLRILLWNANGLFRHLNELELLIHQHKIDILLISETHCTKNSYIRIKGYTAVLANHPLDVSYGGSAILIKSSLIFEEQPSVSNDEYQISHIKLKMRTETVSLAAIYIRPRFNLKQADYENLFANLGNNFLAGGDFNCKHTHWGLVFATQREKNY